MLLCIFLTACAGLKGREDTDSVTQQEDSGSVSTQEDTDSVKQHKEFDISIPEEITMEFFGMNLLEANRPMWEEHVFSLHELGEEDDIFTTFPIGEYNVFHSYMNFENERNFTATITNNNNSGNSQILFDEDGKLTKIDVRSDMGNEFSTSFLNIGDNVKDYFDSFKPDLWDKFLNDKEIVVEQGWNIRHSTMETPEYTYDSLQFFNSDIYISYLIKDELVDYIMLNVIGEVVSNESFETESSIYYLESFDFYIDGENISTMFGKEWANVFGNSCEEIVKSFFDLSEKNVNPMDPESECSTRINGVEVVLTYRGISQYNSNSWMGITMNPVSKLEGEYDSDSKSSHIDFSLSKDGYYNMGVYIRDKCPLITSNCIMPGDNIRTFLNSYEDGLYEKIRSLSGPSEEYCIGPYYFQSIDEGNRIFMGKRDERSLSVIIGVDNEIVTYVERHYSGTVSGFEDKPLLW